MALFGSLYRKSEQKRFFLPTRLIALAVLAASLWLLGLILISHAALESSHSKALSKKNSNVVLSPHAVAAQDDDDNILKDLWPDDLSNENVLESLHSCFDYLDGCHPDHNTPATQKIGLLFLPGSLGLLFADFVQEVVRVHSPNNANDHQNNAVQWIPTSHLPSNADENNYSHIIRFANLPIMLAVGDALLFMTSSDLDTITPLDVQETAQLFISWHCQLSNMADTHSVPLMTMTMEQIEEDPIEQEMFLREFVGNALDDFEQEGDDANKHIDEDELVTSLEQIVGKIQKTLQRINDQQQLANDKRQQKLQTLVNNAIQDALLQGEEKQHCLPNNNINNLFVPTSPLALRVYQFIKPTEDEEAADDQTLCQKEPLAHSLACKTLTLPFPQPPKI
jgi:hypothetical protein